MSKKYFLLVITSVCLIFQVFAQENFRSGYIIKANNDSIQGFIQNQTDEEISEGIVFKTTQNASSIKYSPNLLKRVQFENGRSFLSREITSSANKNPSKVLVKKVLDGKIDVFVHRKNRQSKPNFFLINNETGKTVYIVSPKSDLVQDENGKSYKRDEKKYIGLIKVLKNGGKMEAETEDLKYAENKIIDYFKEYNKGFDNKYPVKAYEEELAFSYDISGGIPVYQEGDGYSFRVAIYRNKMKVERTKKLSVIRGITFQRWANENKEIEIISSGTSNSNYRWQFLSILPWGMKYSFNTGVIQPYVYAAPGLGVLFMTDHVSRDGEYIGSETSVLPTPTVNLGAGMRFKIGSNFLFAEITPALERVFINAGFSF